MDNTVLHAFVANKLELIGVDSRIRGLAVGCGPKMVTTRWTPVAPPLSHVGHSLDEQFAILSALPDGRSAIPVFQYESDYVVYADRYSEVEYLAVCYHDLSVTAIARGCDNLLRFLVGHLYFNCLNHDLDESLLVEVTDYFCIPCVLTYLAKSGIEDWDVFASTLL